jgi:hypothetical protein
MVGRRIKSERQAELKELTKEAISAGLISGQSRDFENLTRSEQKLVRSYGRVVLAYFDKMSDEEIVWRLIWGPQSAGVLEMDDGRRTPVPTDCTQEAVFHVDNLISDAIGDVAAAVRYLRRHTDGSTPEATARGIGKLLHKAMVPLRVSNIDNH